MDFRSLQYFRVVAQELNITKAAEKLHMSQPPLSTQMKNLEEDLGVTLFIRGKRQLTLTDAGRLLLRRSEQMLSLADKTRMDLESMENALSGTINIGLVEGKAPYLVSRWIEGFHEEYPLVKFDLWNGSSDGVIDHMARGLVDIGVIARPYDREHLEGIPVGAEPWVALMSVDHPLAKAHGDTIPLKELVGEALIVPSRRSRMEAITNWFSSIDAEPNILVTTSNYIDAEALAESGAGISIFPETAADRSPNVVSKIITDPMKAAEYVLVVERENHPTSLIAEFINYVRDMMEEDEKTGGPDAFTTPKDVDLL